MADGTYPHIGESLGTDFFSVRDQFDAEAWDKFIATRRFVDKEVLPVIGDYREATEMPWPLINRLLRHARPR